MFKILMIGVPAIACLACLGLAFFQYRRGEQAKSWPTAQGTVTRSGVREHTDSDNNTTYYPDIEYGYAVAGAQLTSGRVSAGFVSSMSQSAATTLAARYPVGAKVTVYYDPAKPSYGVLETGARMVVLVGLIVGAVFAAGLAIHSFITLRSTP